MFNRSQEWKSAISPTKPQCGCFLSGKPRQHVRRRFATVSKDVVGPERLFVLVILTLRTWGVWNRDRRLTIGLPIFFIACWVPMAIFIAIFLNSVECEYELIFSAMRS